MKNHDGFLGKAVCAVVSMVGAIVFSGGINDNGFAQSKDGSKLHVVQEGNTLKLEYTPAPGNMDASLMTVPGHPAEEKVPTTSPDGLALTWPCQNIGQVPNQQCPPAYEDRLGCDGGGANKYCDTRQTPGGIACVCVNVGQ